MDYRLERVKKENLQSYSMLLSSVFTDTKKYSPDFLSWQYYQNPYGDVVGFDAYFGTELAAHYVTIPVLYEWQGSQVKGLLSLNTATAAAHQGKGLFTKLASATYEAAKAEGFQFVIGVANQNSTPGFLRKLGFYLVSPLEVKIFLGKMDVRIPAPQELHSVFTDAAKKWRLANPEADYFSDGQFLYSKTHLPFFKSVLSADKSLADLARGKSSFAPFKLSIGLNLGKPSFAFDLPDKFKPSPLNLIFKDLSGNFPAINKSNCCFQLIDFDAY